MVIVPKELVWRYYEPPGDLSCRFQRDGKKGDLGYE